MELDRTKEINNRTNSQLLINYLEAVIADEMILNSFIRDLEIVDTDPTTVTISLKSMKGIELAKSDYLVLFTDGIRSVYEKELEPRFILNGHNLFNAEKKANSKFISDKFTFANYVEGEFNAEAIKMARSAAKSFGKYSPIYITSKSGLGKTHLLHAIGNELVSMGYSSMYVEPNSFTKNITDSSNGQSETIAKYIESLKEFDVLLFDDIQNLANRTVTLRVLFELLNHAIENGKQVIITSDKPAQELSGFESRFITRFTSGLTTTIKEPSLDDLVKVLEFKLKQENLTPEKWEREALKFIARNNASSIRSIEGAVKRVSFYIEDDQNVKYTYQVISHIFQELAIDPSELTPNRIITTVAAFYKLNKSDLIGKSRKADIAIARHMAIWMVRKILDLPLMEIGKIFGNRDHSTIMSSIKTIDQKMLINNVVKLAAEKIESKIKSVS